MMGRTKKGNNSNLGGASPPITPVADKGDKDEKREKEEIVSQLNALAAKQQETSDALHETNNLLRGLVAHLSGDAAREENRATAQVSSQLGPDGRTNAPSIGVTPPVNALHGGTGGPGACGAEVKGGAEQGGVDGAGEPSGAEASGPPVGPPGGGVRRRLDEEEAFGGDRYDRSAVGGSLELQFLEAMNLTVAGQSVIMQQTPMAYARMAATDPLHTVTGRDAVEEMLRLPADAASSWLSAQLRLPVAVLGVQQVGPDCLALRNPSVALGDRSVAFRDPQRENVIHVLVQREDARSAPRNRDPAVRFPETPGLGARERGDGRSSGSASTTQKGMDAISKELRPLCMGLRCERTDAVRSELAIAVARIQSFDDLTTQEQLMLSEKDVLNAINAAMPEDLRAFQREMGVVLAKGRGTIKSYLVALIEHIFPGEEVNTMALYALKQKDMEVQAFLEKLRETCLYWQAVPDASSKDKAKRNQDLRHLMKSLNEDDKAKYAEVWGPIINRAYKGQLTYVQTVAAMLEQVEIVVTYNDVASLGVNPTRGATAVRNVEEGGIPDTYASMVPVDGQGFPIMSPEQGVALVEFLGEQGVYYVNERLCYACGQPGHIARNCPTPRADLVADASSGHLSAAQGNRLRFNGGGLPGPDGIKRLTSEQRAKMVREANQQAYRQRQGTTAGATAAPRIEPTTEPDWRRILEKLADNTATAEEMRQLSDHLAVRLRQEPLIQPAQPIKVGSNSRGGAKEPRQSK